jgi:uncharacterized protein
MLELRPTCEHCNKALPPDSIEARICSYECTFCATCVATVLGKDPASTIIRHRPVDPVAHAAFAADIKKIASERR